MYKVRNIGYCITINSNTPTKENIMMVEIVKDPAGLEYKVLKKNRVNWSVEELNTSERWNWPARALQHVRFEEENLPVVHPALRIGAVVKIKADAAIAKNSKFAHEVNKKFVLIGFGKALGDFKAIELGGNSRNAFWNIPSTDLELL